MIYVIVGSCGEYSDRRKWLVCAFTDHDAAKAHVLALTEAGNIRRIECDAADERGEWFGANDQYSDEWAGSSLDRRFRYDYSGFNYTCRSVELRA